MCEEINELKTRIWELGDECKRWRERYNEDTVAGWKIADVFMRYAHRMRGMSDDSPEEVIDRMSEEQIDVLIRSDGEDPNEVVVKMRQWVLDAVNNYRATKRGNNDSTS